MPTTNDPQADHPTLFADMAKPEARTFRRASTLAVVANLIWIPQAWQLAAGIGALTAPDAGLDAVLPHAALFLALALLRLALDALAARLASAAALRVSTRAREALLTRIAHASPLDASRQASGALAALLVEKMETAAPHLSRFPMARWRAALVPPILLIAVAPISWVAALVLLVAGPLIPVFMALVGMAAKEASARQMGEIGEMNGVLLDRLRGLWDIRVLSAVDSVATDFADRADRLRRATMAVLRVAFLSTAVLELFAALGVAMVAVYVGFSLLGVLGFGTWGAGLTLSQGLFVLLLAPEFFQPLRDFAAAWHDKASASAVADEFDALARAPQSEILGHGAKAEPLAPVSRIRLRDVQARGLAFPDLEILAGETVALTGPSGAGKSTLLALMAGLLRAERGEILLDETPLGEANADAWRARLAWVSQKPHFLGRSLRANIALGGDPRDLSGIEAALREAAAGGIPARMTGGLNTRLGETGHGVSGGEARRLAVARAAFAGRPVILADEPTADLDPEAARAVGDGLLRLAQQGGTLIVATHDPVLAARLSRRVEIAAAPASPDPDPNRGPGSGPDSDPDPDPEAQRA